MKKAREAKTKVEDEFTDRTRSWTEAEAEAKDKEKANIASLADNAREKAEF